jgi:hypothetical protein
MRIKEVLFLAIIVTSVLSGCLEPENHTVKYTVTSNCDTVDVTYENGHGGTSQSTAQTGFDQNDELIEWTDSFTTTFDGFTFMYISGQSSCGQDDVKVIVAIYVDEDLIAFSDCDGGYCIATASDMR